MNRTHRIIWSESRQAFIVVSEKAKTKGKPCSTVKVVVSAVVMALAAMAASPAMAASSCPGGGGGGAITITGGTETSTCFLVTGDALTVTNTGSISGTNPAVAVTSGAATSITNSGLISGNNIGIYLSSSSVTGAITNNAGGTISGGSTGIDLWNSSVGSISNSGTISGNTGIYLTSSSVTGAITNNAGGTISGNNTGIRLSSNSITGSISNSGTISGGVGGNGRGIWASSSTINGGISNTGSGIISSVGHGIELTGNAILNANGSNQAIYNAGLIQANSAGWGDESAIRINNSQVNGDIVNAGGTLVGAVYGININSSSTVTGSISNSGTISGLNGNGIYLNNSSVTGSITNNAGGTISGSGTGIYLNNGSSVGSISNSGTISGVNAIFVDITSTLANIDIAGNNTASFVGAVSAQNTAMSILAGATYTLKTADAFTVASFTNNGTAQFAAGANSFDLANVTGQTFTNNGTLGVAAGGIGTITGNYTQAANAIFRTDVTNDTTYGKLIVSGIATLPSNAKIDVNVANPNFAFTATSMAGIISAGTLTSDGTFAVTDNSVLFDFTATKNGNAVDLALAVAPTPSSSGVVTAVTSTGNTPGIGAAVVLDRLVTAFAGGTTGNADMDTVIAALGAMTTNQQVSDAVRQTLPLMTGGMAQATFGNLHGVNRVVQARMEGNRGMSSGDSFAGNRKAWVKPLGSWADQKDRNGAFGYAAQTYGVALGADGELSQAYRIGAAFAYTHSNVDSNSGAQTAAVNSYQAVLYGSNSLDENTELNWQADYGYNQNKGNRYIAFVNRTAVADYNSDSIHLGAGIGRTMAMNEQTSFTPSFRADYTSLHANGYSETGAGALNLIVGGQTTDEFVLAVDGKMSHAVSDTSTFVANLGVGYDTQAKQNSISAAFAGGGAAFTTNGINPSATLVRGGLGMVINSSNAMEITARYDVEARTGFTAQTASVKLRMPF